MNIEERGAFYRRGGGSPLGVCTGPKEDLLLLFMVVTPSSWWSPPHQIEVTPI
jgi:hypothetical protein